MYIRHASKHERRVVLHHRLSLRNNPPKHRLREVDYLQVISLSWAPESQKSRNVEKKQLMVLALFYGLMLLNTGAWTLGAEEEGGRNPKIPQKSIRKQVPKRMAPWPQTPKMEPQRVHKSTKK